MVLLKLSFLFLMVSCSKISYLVDQGQGQLALQNRAVPIKRAMKDPRLSDLEKEKLQLIQTYKAYFYQYFNHSEGRIYSFYTPLKSSAVTHLVIASPYNKIEAKKECFPFMGCFPYLGFFDLEKAKRYQKRLEREDYVTYVRPVYAYSTLGYFNDTILSSFFHYNSYDLAELIFHELFHTIFFAKNEVELNENLANYFGKELAKLYFIQEAGHLRKRERLRFKRRRLALEISHKVKEFKQSFEEEAFSQKEAATNYFDDFLNQKFLPAMLKHCEVLELKDCWPLKREWNQAKFAAYLTYESSSHQIQALHQKLGIDLLSFFKYIEDKYKDYQSLSSEEKKTSFQEYLL